MMLLQVLSLSVLVCLSQQAVSTENGNDTDCSTFMKLVSHVIDDDDNFVQVQKTFFPTDNTPPSFVTVKYKFESGEKNWIWSNAFFYFLHPLHVFQFTSLFFSELNTESSNVTLNLPSSCYNVSDDKFNLLTQRLKLYTMRSSIMSPISDDYNPIAHTNYSIKKWHDDHKYQSGYFAASFMIIPIFSIIWIVFIVIYFNNLAPNNRMAYITRMFKVDKNARLIKKDLQDQLILSVLLTVYMLTLSSAAIRFYNNTENHLSKVVVGIIATTQRSPQQQQQHSSQQLTISAFPHITLTIDCVIVAAMILAAIIFACLHRKPPLESSENNTITAIWKFCAYSYLFPLCGLANHFNYIVIAFIHNLFHASSVVVIYGVVIIFFFGILRVISYVAEKKNMNKLWVLAIIKVVVVFFFSLYVQFNILLYYFLPIDDEIDNAANHLISIYQTVFLFLTAMVTYFLIMRQKRSFIQIFTKAELEHDELGIKSEIIEKNNKEQDLLMAQKILSIVKTLPKTNESHQQFLQVTQQLEQVTHQFQQVTEQLQQVTLHYTQGPQMIQELQSVPCQLQQQWPPALQTESHKSQTDPHNSQIESHDFQTEPKEPQTASQKPQLVPQESQTVTNAPTASQSPPKKTSTEWLPDLGLNNKDKEIILNPEENLTDDIMNAAQKLLKKQFPDLKGFQDVVVGRYHKFEKIHGDFVQILYSSPNHWLTISTVGVDHTQVEVLDSAYQKVNESTELQIASIVSTKGVNLVFLDIQQQIGNHDCGLFAIANATAIAHERKPETLLYDQSKMRRHLHDCLENNQLTLFHSDTRSVKKH